MKIAVSSEGPDLTARVSRRLGLSPYLLMADLSTGEIEFASSPGASRSGGGMQVVALIIAEKCQVLLTGYCSPQAENYLSTHGVEVITGVDGTLGEILERYKNETNLTGTKKPGDSESIAGEINLRSTAYAVQKAFHQIMNLLPVMVSVVFLAGLFNTFITKEYLTSLFSGSMWLDSILGAFIGSIFAGNPVNSYIIGGQLLELGVSLAAVTAFLCSWITVGFMQMPTEIAALGWKFTAVRNLSCFGLSLVISLVMVFILKLLGA